MPEGHGGGTGGRRQPQPRRALLTVVGIVVLLIAAIAFANRGDGSGSPDSGGSAAGGSGGSGGGKDTASSTATAPTGERPVTGKAAGIPSGFAHTEQGAQSAAANYAVALGGVDMFNADRRHAILSTIADAKALTTLQAGFDHDYSPSFATQLGLTSDGRAPQGQTFVSRTLPAGAKITRYDGSSADASVWCTGLFGLAGQGSTTPVTSNWFTLTFKLRWNGSDWKVVQTGQSQGPTPVSGDNPVSTADEISGAVQGFGGFTYAR
jgi:hypothetical protein